MSIQSMKVRAVIECGIVVRTPYVLSFTVNKTRNSKSTFSASLKVPSNELDRLTSEITITAGTVRNMNKIFTGYILSTRPSICFDDPSYTILNVSGSDILFKLEGAKYTRRQVSPKTKWALIESVTRTADKSGKFQLVNEPVQLVNEDVFSDVEKRNKNNTTPSLFTLGKANTQSGHYDIGFKFGTTTIEGE